MTPTETLVAERVAERVAQKDNEILAIRMAHEQRVGELESDIAEHKASFDLRWKADMRAIKRWQKATGRKLDWPDHADLCVWLMDTLTTQSALIETLTRERREALRERQIYADQAGELAQVATDHGIRMEAAEAALASLRNAVSQLQGTLEGTARNADAAQKRELAGMLYRYAKTLQAALKSA